MRAAFIALAVALLAPACSGGGGWLEDGTPPSGSKVSATPTVEPTADMQPTASASQYNIEFRIVALEPDPVGAF